MGSVEEVSCEGVMPAFITSTQMPNRIRNHKQPCFSIQSQQYLRHPTY